jgi:hypothetical protein
MKKLLLIGTLLWLFIPARALAAEPLRPTQQISVTEITLPFDFEVISFERTGPPLPAIDFVDTALVNQIGSIALTLFSFFNVEIIGIFVVLALAMIAVAWVFSFVTDTPSAGAAIKHSSPMSMDEAANLAYGAANAQINYDEQQAGKLMVGQVMGQIESGTSPDDAWAWGDDQMKYARAGWGERRANLKGYKKTYQQGSSAYKRLRR